jgi:5-methylcytosine-specific restriction endonuclease McrA
MARGAPRAKSARTAHSGTYRRMNFSAYNTVGGQTKAGAWWDLRAQAMKRAGNRCEHRGCTSPAVEVHHIVPLSRGGRNALSNLMCLCRGHHDARHAHLRGREHH